MKRLIDVVLSLAGLVFFAPVFGLLALLTKVDSQGPVFYRGVRAGRFGKPFRIFKFRTMVAMADKIGGPSSADDDPRITHLGHLLRRYKLDELPQLLNVVTGEMSLVGPRPEVMQEVLLYTEDEKRLLEMRPDLRIGLLLSSAMRVRSSGAALIRTRHTVSSYARKKSALAWSMSPTIQR